MTLQHSDDVMFLVQLKSSAEEVVFVGHGFDLQGTASMFHPFMIPIGNDIDLRTVHNRKWFRQVKTHLMTTIWIPLPEGV